MLCDARGKAVKTEKTELQEGNIADSINGHYVVWLFIRLLTENVIVAYDCEDSSYKLINMKY